MLFEMSNIFVNNIKCEGYRKGLSKFSYKNVESFYCVESWCLQIYKALLDF